MIIEIAKKYTWLINILLLAGLAYSLALMINGKIESGLRSQSSVALQGVSQNKMPTVDQFKENPPLSHYQVITTRNIFGIRNIAKATRGIETLPESKLNLALLGTIMKPNDQSVAIIKNVGNDKIGGYKGGETIKVVKTENVKLIKVQNCMAVIERPGKGYETIKCQSLGTSKVTKIASSPSARSVSNKSDSKGVNKIGENEYEIDKRLVEETLSNPNTIIQQARIIPQKNGIKFFGIRSGSILRKIGLKSGDTLQRINKVELNNVEKALPVFNELRTQSYFTIEYTRAGKNYVNEYTVK